MANYAFLSEGNHLPAVGVLQKLLNRGGARLSPDGVFGRNTRAAVVNFQRARNLTPDGVVGQNTWPRIASGAHLPIVDFVDIFDPSLMDLEAADISRAGGNPLLIGGMSNGVEQMTRMILSSGARNVFLLRFHGHGAPGVAGVSFGQGGKGFGHRADLDNNNLNVLLPTIARLRTIFGPYGCVQFMHCETGRGPNGRALIAAISRTLQVPVSAGINIQLGGGVNTFRFEGPTFTASPRGDLRSWCAALPDFAPMSVA